MNIKAKLKLLAVMPVLLFVITGVIFFTSSHYIGLNNKKALLADDIVKTTSDLTILSYEHNITHEERPHMQWLEKYAALGALLKEAKASFTNDDENPLLDDINRNYDAAGKVFGEIEAQLKATGDSAPEGREEYYSRLHSRLLIELQSIIPRADKLHHISHENVLRYARAQASLNTLFIVLLAVFVPAVSLFLTRGIAGPISRLEQGMKVFASGGREPVPVSTGDELGALTQGFNEMSEKLWKQSQFDASMAEISRRILHDKGISIDDVSQIILECAQRLTASQFGLAGYLDPETGFLVAPTLSREVLAQCQVADKSIVLKKFGGLWGWVRKNKEAALCNNLATDPRATGLPAGHAAIMRFLSVPAMIGETLVGQVALANAPHDYTDADLRLVGKIAEFYAIALQRLRLEEEISKSYAALESRVEERTAELLASEQKYKMLVENALVGIYKSKTNGEIIFVNQALARIYEFDSVEEMRSTGSLARYKDPAARQAMLEELQQQGRLDSYELEMLTKQGNTRNILLSMNLDGDTLSGMVIDISARKQADAKLKMTADELERSNRELQQFAYIASHDLQEPLRKITAFGDRLGMHAAEALDEKSRDYLARMQSAASRMKHLIEDLLDYSRVTTQAKPFAAVNLGELLGETLETLDFRVAESGGQVEIVGTLPTVPGDRSQLRQLFQNLLGNALKYHQYDLPPRIIVSSQPRADGLAEVVVTDNGIGFDEKYLDRIFLPFQRLHARQEYEGTGIGLAICQKIVHRHGGTLTARSQPGVGSSFVVTLPISRNEVSHEHTEKTGGDPDCRG